MISEIIALYNGCKNINICNCTTKLFYEEINNSEFYIYDPPPEEKLPCKIVINKNDIYHLSVINSKSSSSSIFIKTDNCLFFTDEHKKCDCILFANNYLYLIEIKNSSAGTKKVKRKKAVEQIEKTIDKLIHINSWNSLNKKAVICFASINDYPIQASKNTRRAEFKEKYNVDLIEGNLINI